MQFRIKTLLDNITARDANVPLSIKCELTHRCNFNCHHCYCRLPRNSATNELDLKEWDRILGESVDEGALFLTITGGEPLLRPDFKEIWKIAKRRGLLLSLFSNGSLIDEEMVGFFQKWSPNNISITLYGATEKTYHEMTGVPGMLSKVTKTLELLQKAAIPFSTRSIITQRNVHEFDMLEKLNIHYSNTFFWDAELFGANAEGGNFPFRERLSPEEVINLEHSHEERKKGIEELLVTYHGEEKIPQKSFRCSLGKRGFGVDPYGNMLACLVLDRVKYNLREGTVHHGWFTHLPQAIDTLHWGNSPCKDCQLAQFCRICPAFSLREGAPQEGPTKYHCAIGKARFKKFKYCLKNQKEKV